MCWLLIGRILGTLASTWPLIGHLGPRVPDHQPLLAAEALVVLAEDVDLHRQGPDLVPGVPEALHHQALDPSHVGRVVQPILIVNLKHYIYENSVIIWQDEIVLIRLKAIVYCFDPSKL